LLDSSLLPGVTAFPFFGSASVIVCQGADLIAIRPRRPPRGDPQHWPRSAGSESSGGDVRSSAGRSSGGHYSWLLPRSDRGSLGV